MTERICEYLYVRCIWLYVLVMSGTRFRVNPHSIVASMLRNSFLKTNRNLMCKWLLLDWTHNRLFRKGTFNYFAKLSKCYTWVVSTCLYGAFDCMVLSCHVRVSEWIHTLLFPECLGTPCSKQGRNLKFKWLQLDSTQNYLVCKQTLKHFATLIKWLSWVVSTYLYGAFDCMLLSCHVRVLEWILTL